MAELTLLKSTFVACLKTKCRMKAFHWDVNIKDWDFYHTKSIYIIFPFKKESEHLQNFCNAFLMQMS